MRSIERPGGHGPARAAPVGPERPLDLTGTGEITDDGRIWASLPVISKRPTGGARGHSSSRNSGRPEGASFEERAAGGPSLRPAAARLGEVLWRPVSFGADVAGHLGGGNRVQPRGRRRRGCWRTCVSSRPRPVMTTPSAAAEFAQRLARLGEVCTLGDGFGAVHRKHASVYDLPLLLPHAAGDPSPGRGGRAASAHRRPGPALRSGARRQEAVGQAGRDRQPAEPGCRTAS